MQSGNDQDFKAMIIGISEYEGNLPPLNVSKNDGQALYDLLQNINYEIPNNFLLLGHVKYEKMRTEIHNFFLNDTIYPENTLFFYYSGHSIIDVNGNGYLASSDADPNRPELGGFSFSTLTSLVNKCVAKRIVIILDCSYSGSITLGEK